MGLFEPVEKLVEETVKDAEEILPHPLGAIARFEKEQKAKRESESHIVEEVGRYQAKAVRTFSEAANLCSVKCVVLGSANLHAQLVPRDQNRLNAVILAVDNDVWIAADEGTAISVAGISTASGAFYLPAGIAIPIQSQSQLWAAATVTATNTRISVIINRNSA